MKKITFIIALLTSLATHAQWNMDTTVNTLVASSNVDDMKSIGRSDGQTYVVFWKSVPSPTNYELRVQLLDAGGNQQLGPDGALISDSIPMSTFTSFWTVNVDNNDNLYVGVTGTDNDEGFAFKVDDTGAVLWTVSNPSALLVKTLPMSSGETVVAWLSTSSYTATMQKYDFNGNPIWSANQTVANTGTAPAELFELSTGGYIMVFHQLGTGINSTLYAQRFDTNGNAVWATRSQLSNKTTAYNTIYDGTQDGDVVYFSYFGKTGTRFDSFLQRINADGTLPWGINGSDFDTNTTNYEKRTSVAFSAGSNYVWAVCNYTNPSQSNNGEYIQKFDKVSGARLLTATAKEIYPIGSEKVHAGPLQLLNDSALLLIKEGVDNGVNPTTLHAVLLDENGDFAWPEEKRAMATFSANKSRVQFNTPVNGQVVTVFTEDKGTGSKIYAQNVVVGLVVCTLDIVCPADITVNVDTSMCTASGVSLGIPVTSTCSSQTISNDAPTVYPLGQTTVTWTLTDGTDTVNCTQLVTVVNELVISCPADIMLNADSGMCSASGVALGTPFTSSCPNGTVSNNAPAVFELGETMVTWTLTVGSDSVNCIQLVTVVSNSVMTCPVDIIVTADSGLCTASGVALGTPFTSSCPNETVSNDAPTVFELGETMVTWSLSDGTNEIECIQLVTVIDNENPTISCPENQTQQADVANDLYTLPDYFMINEATATDNCTAPVTLTTQNPASGTQLAVGVHTINLTAEDASGNISTCTFDLTVEKSLGVEDVNQFVSLSMTPNPATDLVSISNPMNLALETIIIYDLEGRIVRKIDLDSAHSNYKVDISNLASASYIIKINGEAGHIVKRLIKE